MAPPANNPYGSPPPIDVTVALSEPDRESLARRLGRFILEHLPYGKTTSFPPPINDVPTPDVVEIPVQYKATGPVTISGLYPGATAAHPFIRKPFVGLPEMLSELTPEQLAEIEYWPMDGVTHMITKAIRIWYTYEIEDATAPGGKRTVGAWLLVGYLGDGHQ